jgi:hypothetical protein
MAPAGTLNDMPLRLDAAAPQLSFDGFKDQCDWRHR